MDTLYKQFAATYDCGAYGAGAYDSDQTCTTSTDGGLAGTGTNVAIGVAGGVLLIIIAVVLIIRTRKNAKKASN